MPQMQLPPNALPAQPLPNRNQFANRSVSGNPTMASMEFPAEAMVAEAYAVPFPTAPHADPYYQPQAGPNPGGRVQNLPSTDGSNWSEPVRTPVVGPFLIFLVAALVTGIVYLLGKNFLFPT